MRGGSCLSPAQRKTHSVVFRDEGNCPIDTDVGSCLLPLKVAVAFKFVWRNFFEVEDEASHGGGGGGWEEGRPTELWC